MLCFSFSIFLPVNKRVQWSVKIQMQGNYYNPSHIVQQSKFFQSNIKQPSTYFSHPISSCGRSMNPVVEEAQFELSNQLVQARKGTSQL